MMLKITGDIGRVIAFYIVVTWFFSVSAIACVWGLMCSNYAGFSFYVRLGVGFISA
jgi:hypothetical protein